ncbi:claudin-2-like [Tachyglossus aculeatus]|uniref:claudin-2-like n=1 Tax=Tachyglossus aculeatus TaxID=9261 RepID=UPI0018F41357|nr:claudin-2-like [Tachyglossus aculeatus]
MAYTVREICIPVLALLFGGAGFIICNVITNSMFWRVWHYDNTNISTIWLGLWNFCYQPRDPSNPTAILDKVCLRMSLTWEYPGEISLSQDLMSLATVLEGVGLLFTFVGFLCTLKEEPYSEFYHCFRIGGTFLTVGCLIVIGTVSWNFYLDSVSKPLSYPREFPLQDQPEDRDIGPALPLGSISSLFGLQSGALLITHGCSVRAVSETSVQV